MRIQAHNIIVLLAVAFTMATVCNAEAVDKKKDFENKTAAGPSERDNGKDDLLRTSAENDDVHNYEKRIRLARMNWKKTFEEIKSIVVDVSPEGQKKGRKARRKEFDQWKLFLDGENRGVSGLASNDTALDVELVHSPSTRNSTVVVVSDENGRPRRLRQRFDGFANWDGLLQQWADDARHYGSKEKVGIKRNSEMPIMAPRQKEVIPFSPRIARPGEKILPHTDIGDKSKNIWIVTTAALPWMTGTGVNPLLRAAYMTQGRDEAGGKVTLMLPWLELEKDRDNICGKEREFDTSEGQEKWIRTWLSDKAELKEASESLNIAWYTGRHETQENSIYSMGDIIAIIPREDADICILEEPEHLNWYRAPGESWTSKFKHVVGIVHTNYFVYAQEQPAAYLRAPGMRLLSSWMCRAHCHRIIKLSGTLGKFAPEKELVENVHGVRNAFLEYGKGLSKTLKSPEGTRNPVFGPNAEPKVYFIGKMLWSKGIGSLMELLKYAEESADLKVDFDMYGGGPNFDEAQQRSKKLGLSMEFHGPIDHAALASTHKIFVNPSLSEVLCTTVAEALAMGKFVVVPSHPSNDFFAQFPNCLTYANKEEFVGNLYYALTHSPESLSEEYSYALSWNAANERCAAAGCITMEEADEFAHAMSSDEAGIEIGLPPLIEDEERRKKLSTTVKNTRERYREFRANLSHEIRQSNVLPQDIQKRILSELDKRLDLDVDSLLYSPKLKLQLSPAELDKQLLDLYNAVADNPSADILRTVMGGANVGRQSYYLKQQARKEKTRARLEFREKNALPQFLDDVGVGEYQSPTSWIKKTLRRNLQQNGSQSFLQDKKISTLNIENKNSHRKEDETTMIVTFGKSQPYSAIPFYSFPKQHYAKRLGSRLPSLLI